jgi:predicted deacetylase
MVFQRLLGPYGKMPILIRDDDTNFFTKTNMLESIYSKAWEDGYKICLAVVPFQRGINDISVPPNIRTTDLHFSIADNKPLADYLKDKIRNGTIEVLQHGFSHYFGKDGRGEFGKDLDKMKDIELGRNIIKQAFGVDPKFFVPPGEDISKQNLMTLVGLGFVPIYRQTFFDTFLRNSFVPAYFKNIATRALAIKYKNRHRDGNWALQFVKPVMISVGQDTISWNLASVKSANLSSFDSLSKLTDKVIGSCMISRSPVCIINHYHLYYYDWNPSITRKDLFQAWRQILKTFDRLKFGWKVTFSELYERANQIQNIRIAKTGSKITIESETRIRGFSFRTRHPLEPNTTVLFDEESSIITIEDLLPQNKVILYERS